MNRYLFVFVAIGLFCFGLQAKQAQAAISFVQATSSPYITNPSQTTCSAKLNGVGANDLLIFSYRVSSSTATTSVVDSASDTWSFAASTTNTTANLQEWTYYAIAIGGTTNVTGTTSVGGLSSQSCILAEYSGIAIPNPLDVTSVAHGGSTSANAGTSTTNFANELIVSSVGMYSAPGSTSPGTGFALALSTTTINTIRHAMEFEVVSSTGAYSAPLTASSTMSYWSSVMATFQASLDTTPPSVSWISPSPNATVSSTITLTASSTDNVAVQSIALSEGPLGGTLASSTPIGTSTSTASGTIVYSIPWTTTSTANGSTTLWALSTDTSNNTSTASTTVNVENPPTIYGISVSAASSSATITWTTNEGASSQVNYGLTSGYGSSTVTSTLTTSHSITLSGLATSVTYHFQIQSADAGGNTATTPDATFVPTAIVYVQSGGGYNNGVATSTQCVLSIRCQRVICSLVHILPITLVYLGI